MIERGIRVFGIWAGDGDPSAIPELNITIEDWNGVNTAVMTLVESDGFFSDSYDGSSTESIDMRYYPRALSGSGGTISLIDNGWYSTFQNAGYSFRGSRIERFYVDDSGETVINTFYISTAKDLVGLVQLQLSPIAKQLENPLSGTVDGYRESFIVGDWKGVTIDAEGDGEKPLFDGVLFRQYYTENYTEVPKVTDSTGAPIEWDVYLVPTTSGFDWSTVGDNTTLPENSYIKVVNGVGDGSILQARDSILPKYDGGGSYAWRVWVENKYGVPVDESNLEGIYWNVQDAPNGLVDWGTVGFFQNNYVFKKDSQATVTKVVSEGTEYQFIDAGDKIEVQDNLGVIPIIYKPFFPNFSTNSNYVDMKPFFDGSGWEDWTSGDHCYRQGSVSGLIGETGINNVSSRNKSLADSRRCSASVPLGETAQIQMSYYCDQIPEEFTGIALRSFVSTTSAIVGARAEAKFVAYVVFVYNNTEGSYGETYKERVFQTEFDAHTAPTSGTKTSAIKNIGVGYYSEDQEDADVINALTDNRHLPNTSLIGGSPFDPAVVVARGNGIIEIDTSLLSTKPSACYVSLGVKVASTGVGGAELEDVAVAVSDLSFVSKTITRTEPLDSIEVDITGRSYGDAGTTITEIAKLQNLSQFKTVGYSIESDSTPVRRYENSDSALNTSYMLQELHRETWTVGYMRRDGVYVSKKVASLIGDTSTPPMSHQFVVPVGCKLAGSVTSYEFDNLPTGGTIQYDRQPDGSYAKSITITGAENETFLDEYVSGVSDPAKAFELWNAARLIYKKTGVNVDFRSDQKKLNWIYLEENAVEYAQNIFSWNGGRGFSRDVISAKIEVVDIDSQSYPWNIGDYCSVFIPRITPSAYTGVITGVTFNSETYSATIDVRAGQVNLPPDTITEVGTGQGADTITELDTNTDTITEKGLV